MMPETADAEGTGGALFKTTPESWYVGIPIIVVCQRKGGPGKTTLVRTFAEYLALVLKLRVLLLDFDTQCSLSHLYLSMEEDPITGSIRPPVHPDYAEEGDRFSTANLFSTAVEPVPPVPYAATRMKGDFVIDILPGDKQRLVDAERTHETAGTDLKLRIENRTLAFFESCHGIINQHYDVVLADTAPAASPLTLSVLRAATHMLIPLEFEEQCVKGMRDMVSMWGTENSVRPRQRHLEILAIQPNKVKLRRKLQVKYHRIIRNSDRLGPLLSGVLLPDRSEFAERDAENAAPLSIFQLPTSNEARIYAEHFGAKVSERLFGSLLKIPTPPPLPEKSQTKKLRENEETEVV